MSLLRQQKKSYLFSLLFFLILPLLIPNFTKNSFAKTIELEHHPGSLAILGESKAFVLLEKEGSLVEIDTIAGAVTNTFSIGEKPRSIAIYPEKMLGVVALEKSDSVGILDLNTGQIIKTIPTGKDPKAVTINRLTGMAIVANHKGNSISIINLNTLLKDKDVAVGEDPNAVAVYSKENIVIIALEKNGLLQTVKIDTGEILSNINTGKNPYRIAVDELTGEALLLDKKNNELIFIDILLGTVTNTLPIGKNPTDIALNDKKQAYIVCSKDDNIVVVDLITKSILGKIPVGKSPHHIDIHPLSNTAVISSKDKKIVTVLNLNTVAYSTTVSVGKNPKGLAIHETLNIAVIANEKSDDISVLDIKSNTILHTLKVAKGPIAVAIDEITDQAVIISKKSNRITFVDLIENVVTGTLNTGKDPRNVAINSNTGKAVITNEKDDNFYFIDLVSKSLIKIISVGKRPHGVSIDTDLNRAVIANKKDDTVSIVDLNSYEILFVTAVGRNPKEVTVNSDLHIASVVNTKDDSVSLVSTVDGTLIKNLSVGKNPDGIEIDSPDRVYVVNGHEKNISIINLLQQIVTGTIPVEGKINKIAVNKKTHTLVLTNSKEDTVTIINANQPPVVTDDVANILEDTPVEIAVLDNDSDPNDDLLTILETTTPINGTATINSDNTITYTPAENFNGTDTFIYTVTDGNLTIKADVKIIITAVNDAPVSYNDFVSTSEDNTVNITVLTNDIDVENDVLTVLSVGPASNGAVDLNTDNTITYTPNLNFNGIDSFSYTITDGNLTSESTVKVNVTPVNDIPLIVDDSITTNEDEVNIVLVLANDFDADGNILTVTSVTLPANGTALINPDQTITYTPNPDYNGTDTFDYTASDQNGGTGTAHVNITISPVNDAPTLALIAPITVNEGETITLLPIVTDADNDPITITYSGWMTTSTFTTTFSDAGQYIVTVTVSDGLLIDFQDVTVTVISQNHIPTVNAGTDQTVNENSTVTLAGNGFDLDGDALTYSWTQTLGTTVTLSDTTIINPSFISPIITTSSEELVFQLTANDGIENSAPDYVVITINKTTVPLPPDPADIAPVIDQTVPTTVKSATDFIYTGDAPIQKDVLPGTIEAKRVASIRGMVKTREGSPLAGVLIEILNHPEFGSTLSRADGMFDMVINGGGILTVNYKRDNYLSAQRKIDTPWQGYLVLEDVALIPLDIKVTAIELNSSIPIQEARGSVVTDERGTRQGTILFPKGTTAVMKLPDGTTQSLTNLNVRATEYTVGPNGPAAMPGELPPTSGYTYAVELSVDEAVGANAKTVIFNQPVYYYVENFIGFPTGTIVPVGFYDYEKAAWIPSDNGLVIKILSVIDGIAQIDTDDSNLPADTETLTSLGITTAEQQKLADLYVPGDSLWRVNGIHLS